MKNIAFLGYDKTQTRLIEYIENRGINVFNTSKKIKSLDKFDLVIIFGYRHILDEELINTLHRPPINLHISYLPYNKGAHPNFWAFIENTPSGVTIHEVDKIIDSGDICFQKEVRFPEYYDTFSKTYKYLVDQIEDLFISKIEEIFLRSYIPIPQKIDGTFHKTKDLPNWMNNWDMKISEAITIFKNQEK